MASVGPRQSGHTLERQPASTAGPGATSRGTAPSHHAESAAPSEQALFVAKSRHEAFQPVQYTGHITALLQADLENIGSE